MEITGDKGEKQIINRHPEDVTYFKIEDARGTSGYRHSRDKIKPIIQEAYFLYGRFLFRK